jgi:hypothetical protein
LAHVSRFHLTLQERAIIALMSDQYRKLTPRPLRLGAAALCSWRWAGLRLTSRGFMAA